MFYVAFLPKAKVHTVIPVTWVFDSEKVVEKFIRKAINSNQKHLAYYSKKKFNGMPDGRIDPDFTVPEADVFPCDAEEACYIAQIAHCFSKIYFYNTYKT